MGIILPAFAYGIGYCDEIVPAMVGTAPMNGIGGELVPMLDGLTENAMSHDL